MLISESFTVKLMSLAIDTDLLTKLLHTILFFLCTTGCFMITLCYFETWAGKSSTLRTASSMRQIQVIVLLISIFKMIATEVCLFCRGEICSLNWTAAIHSNNKSEISFFFIYRNPKIKKFYKWSKLNLLNELILKLNYMMIKQICITCRRKMYIKMPIFEKQHC